MSRTIELVARWCYEQLPDSLGYKYFQVREISDNEVRTFGLGYFPKNSERQLIDYVEKRDGDRQELFKRAIVFEDKLRSSSFYSMFSSRVIIPYCTVYGEVIGFTGRAIEKGQEPKYVNTIFLKAQEPYNLQKAKDEARERDTIFIVEGHVCCITSWRKGLRNVIAGGGTAITQDHILKATRYAKTVCVIVDNDDAGLKAAQKILTFARDDYVLQVLVLPKILNLDNNTVEIKDLDDFFVKGKRSKDDFWNFYYESFKLIDSSQILRERVNRIEKI